MLVPIDDPNNGAFPTSVSSGTTVLANLDKHLAPGQLVWLQFDLDGGTNGTAVDLAARRTALALLTLG